MNQSEHAQVRRLRQLVEDHRRRYYVSMSPTISDFEYDDLVRRLRALEACTSSQCSTTETEDRSGGLISLAGKAADSKRHLLAWALTRLNLALRPDDYSCLCLLARCYYYRGNDRAADMTYRRAITVKPSLPRAHMGLGQLHYYNAMRVTNDNRLFPGGVDLMFENELPANDYDLEHMPSVLHSSRADQVVANRNVAISELELAADLESDRDVAMLCLDQAASLYCERRHYARAELLYRRIIAIDQNRATAHMHLVGCYAELGSQSQAREEFEWLRSHAPDLAEEVRPYVQHRGDKR